jgi:broad specificity polyphosphatase/5'/3'-nucleotidase SurE
VTEIAKLHYGCLFEKSPRKNEFAFLKDISSAKGAKYDLQPGTDAYTVFIERKISVTPINIDMTGNLLEFRKWMGFEI